MSFLRSVKNAKLWNLQRKYLIIYHYDFIIAVILSFVEISYDLVNAIIIAFGWCLVHLLPKLRLWLWKQNDLFHV